MFLVMGITGKVGGATAEHLLAHGKEVRALVRNREKAANWANQGVKLVDGDWNDSASIERALKGVEGAFVIGRSAGPAPFRILSTKAATRCQDSSRSGPKDIKPPASRYSFQPKTLGRCWVRANSAMRTRLRHSVASGKPSPRPEASQLSAGPTGALGRRDAHNGRLKRATANGC
jgi:NAD(P)-dependent dehydrogenase (short-subunit alcohol dehydrogenase family)